jgi:hypothetical protein
VPREQFALCYDFARNGETACQWFKAAA